MDLNKEKVAEGWRKVYSIELHNTYFSPDMNGFRNRSMKHVACMGEIRNAHKMLVRN
jgi:hypothetical protein